ncbi:hypothetical protein BASA50_000658 [Batrachochytrium salamandrivorans]|uniref:Uncharacterized protein n=1 Tax=Batrachochytrium salamandrivorans TaxID=1357716 RepID=A0ABQ8ET87_9FUNG|nr:hypothetical protein BASA60_007122 [Batrachochytrium salamandrivorans]KAH6579608.1 hypothetical protein BASA61_010124 [Batrachochytrium salamandrivorans]KAH6586193.1 hypothetical protein BASA50_000658 [Batrachochytrium salamandrivorans]KAJ1336891.1 hypothetical protein BSLG_006651 [Batrachochytrium salamandrivorans]
MGSQDLSDRIQFYMSLLSIVFVVPCYLFGCCTIATAPPPTRTTGLRVVRNGDKVPERQERSAFSDEPQIAGASMETVPASMEIVPANMEKTSTITQRTSGIGRSLSSLLTRGAARAPRKCSDDTKTSDMPFSQQIMRRWIFMLSPNAIIWFLNAAFLLALLAICSESLTHWSIAYNSQFDIQESIIVWKTHVIVDYIKMLRRVTQVMYFLTSVWIKHRLVRSLPGTSSGIVTWTTSIVISSVAIVPNIPQLSGLSHLSRPMLDSIAILLMGFCMSVLAWVYVYLSIRNIKAATLSYWNTIEIIQENLLLNRWLIVRPLILLGILFLPLSLISVKKTPLSFPSYIAIIIVSDFLFEYQQIQKGLFAMLVREISLPIDVRRKLDQARNLDGSPPNDINWGDTLCDLPQDFEGVGNSPMFNHYDFEAADRTSLHTDTSPMSSAVRSDMDLITHEDPADVDRITPYSQHQVIVVSRSDA